MMNNRTTELRIAYLLLLVSAVCFIVHFLFFRHSFPPVNIDEASFFSPAQSLSKKGVLASDIHKSFLPGSATYTFWMPPLYILLLGGVFEVFGSTVIMAKILSLALSIASVVMLLSLAKNKFEKIAAAALFLLCPFIIITSAFIRVEALAIFLTVLAIVAVNKKWSVLLLGVIAGLSVMTHPLMLACGAGLGLTALRRGFKPLIFFTLSFLIIISPYIWYIMQDVELFKDQMSLQFLRKSKAKLFDVKPMYLLQSVPMVLLALFCLYKVKVANEFRLFLAFSIVLALAIVLKSNEFNYQVYLVPYVIAAVVLAMQERKELKLFRWGIPFLLYGFFAVVLLSKLMKYQFRTDASYKELVANLESDKSWNGKHIYETGGPDVATHLLMREQDVERGIPVPMELPQDWFTKYDYVIDVKENISSGDNSNETDTMRPWINWKQTSFTTSDSAYTLTRYNR